MEKMWKVATINMEVAHRMAADMETETAEEEQNSCVMAEELSETKDEEIFPLDSELPVLAGEKKKATDAEQGKILRHLQSAHSGSRHYSNGARVRALNRKGARPEGFKAERDSSARTVRKASEDSGHRHQTSPCHRSGGTPRRRSATRAR